MILAIRRRYLEPLQLLYEKIPVVCRRRRVERAVFQQIGNGASRAAYRFHLRCAAFARARLEAAAKRAHPMRQDSCTFRLARPGESKVTAFLSVLLSGIWR